MSTATNENTTTPCPVCGAPEIITGEHQNCQICGLALVASSNLSETIGRPCYCAIEIIANTKLIGSQSETPLDSRAGVLPYQPQRNHPIHEDPRDVLTRLVLRDGCVKMVGEICEKNPNTAQWLIRKIENVDESRVREGKASGRFEAYASAARQAIARVACMALLDEIKKGGKA